MDCECPRGRHDSSTQPTIVRIKLGINPFSLTVQLLFGLTRSTVNLPRGSSPQASHWLEEITLQTGYDPSY